MKQVFADTHYFLALLNARDQAHLRAVEFSARDDLAIITTLLVVTELANSLAKSSKRTALGRLFATLEADQNTTLVWLPDGLFRRGIQYYASRNDKDWSLVDCISFIVMEEHGIHEALTADHHFEQAGFLALLK